MTRSPRRSGDDVGRQSILKQNDPVAQRKFTFFQPSDLKFVRDADGGEGVDGRFEIAMFKT